MCVCGGGVFVKSPEKKAEDRELTGMGGERKRQ